MTGTDERVAIRRKSDGKWARKGGGNLPFWWEKPTAVKSAAKARNIVRIDFGLDLDDVEILPWAEVPDEVKQ